MSSSSSSSSSSALVLRSSRAGEALDEAKVAALEAQVRALAQPKDDADDTRRYVESRARSRYIIMELFFLRDLIRFKREMHVRTLPVNDEQRYNNAKAADITALHDLLHKFDYDQLYRLVGVFRGDSARIKVWNAAQDAAALA